ncbi:MAG TPA: nitroreductase family protein [Pilimelia sp.]|nr:nitroreductase family protein [Pilimelia sp.]
MDTHCGMSIEGAPGTNLGGCLRAAIAAPSLHNSQPWLFRVRDGRIDVLADRTRQLALIDPDARELTISVGAAVLNLRVAILARGRLPLLRLLPSPMEPDLLATVVLGPRASGIGTARLLDRAIPQRRTNRRPFRDVAVPPEVVAELAAAARAEDGGLTVLEPDLCGSVFDIVRIAEGRRRADPAYLAELDRWTGDEPGRPDGILPAAYGPWPALRSVPLRDFGLVHPGRRRREARFEQEPTVVLLHTAGDGVREWLHGGQALERVLLTATFRGVAATLMTQPLEIPQLRHLLNEQVAGRSVQAIIRLGYGPPSAPSPRRPLADVLVAAPAPSPAWTTGGSVR